MSILGRRMGWRTAAFGLRCGGCGVWSSCSRRCVGSFAERPTPAWPWRSSPRVSPRLRRRLIIVKATAVASRSRARSAATFVWCTIGPVSTRHRSPAMPSTPIPVGVLHAQDEHALRHPASVTKGDDALHALRAVGARPAQPRDAHPDLGACRLDAADQARPASGLDDPHRRRHRCHGHQIGQRHGGWRWPRPSAATRPPSPA